MSINSRRILLIGGNFYPELTGIGKYNGEMIQWLSIKGYDCSVITTYPYYPQWSLQPPYEKAKWYQHQKLFINENSKPINVYRCPHYIPSFPSGLKRIISDISFTITAFFQLVKLLFHDRFDIVIVVAPPFHTGYLALFYRLFRTTKIVYHIQDLQVDAADKMGMIKFKPIIKILYELEKILLKKSNIVSSISVGMIRKIKRKGIESVLFFPNWVDSQNIFKKEVSSFSLNSLGIESTKKVIFYSGAIGEKQGLDIIIEIAAYFQKNENNEYVFLISGEGPYKKILKQKVIASGLKTIYFSNLLPTIEFNELLNTAHFHLILQKKDAEDLVLPSKLTNILAVGGVSVVTAQPNTSLYDLIAENNIGIIAVPENAYSIFEAITNTSEEQYLQIKENAARYSNEYLNKNVVLENYFKQIEI